LKRGLAGLHITGHDEKNSLRAYLVCITPITGIPKCCRQIWAPPSPENQQSYPRKNFPAFALHFCTTLQQILGRDIGSLKRY
jgi:hypothetical protein